MVVKENAVELLTKFVESEKLIRVVEATKLGVEKDNLVIVDLMLQNVLTQLFLELPKTIDAEDSDFTEVGPKVDSIKKFLKGDDKRFSVGLDLACTYMLKNKRTKMKVQSLFINENANTIKFFEDKELEYVPVDEIVDVYNLFINELNKFYTTDILDSIKL